MNDAATLSREQLDTLTAALDGIIPPGRDERFPGAGELGLAEALAARSELVPLLAAGAAALDELARERGASRFTEVPRPERRALLEASGERAPGFLPIALGQTFLLYYQDARVREALGLEARPPFPLGYPVPDTDLSILEPVRGRAPFYREP